jgi:hypothetical protein
MRSLHGSGILELISSRLTRERCIASDIRSFQRGEYASINLAWRRSDFGHKMTRPGGKQHFPVVRYANQIQRTTNSQQIVLDEAGQYLHIR